MRAASHIGRRVRAAAAAALLAGVICTLPQTELHARASLLIMDDGTMFDSDWYSAQLTQSGVSGIGTGVTELYRHYQLYGQGDGLTAYDATAWNEILLQEMVKYSESVRDQLLAANGPGWLTVTADIYDTEEIAFWNMEEIYVSEETFAALAQAIDVFEDKGYEIGFVLVDLSTGEGISYRAGIEVYSASVIKGPYIFSLLESGIAPTDDMYQAGHNSDNDAYERIRTTYGHTVFANWIEGTNIPYKHSQTRYITTTPLDLCRMFYKGKDLLLGDETYSDWARSTFTDSLNSAVALTVGEEKTVYSKAGWISGSGQYYSSSYTNGAIVVDEYPYVVVLMSDSPGYAGLEYAQELAPVLDQVHEEMMAHYAEAQTAALSEEEEQLSALSDFASDAAAAVE